MAKQLPPQVQSALLWAKANTIVVVFCAIVIAVPAGAFYFAGQFRDSVRDDAQKKASIHSDLSSMAKKSVSLPIPGGEPFPLAGLPNEDVVREYEQILAKVGTDAQAVYSSARDFNLGGIAERKHTPVVPASVFPNYNRANRSDAESVRFRFGDALRASYERLLADCRTGVPPEPASLRNAIEAAEKRFVQGELKQESRAKLDAAQTAALEKQLGKARIEQYFEVAKRISFYVDPDAFPIPTRDSMNKILPSGSDAAVAFDKQDAALFDEQWKFWIISDVLHAFRDANSANPSVLQAPVKRVARINVLAPEAGAAPAAVGGEASAMGGEVAMEGGETPPDAVAGGSAAGAATTGLGIPQIDPKVEAPRDFSRRFTGRVSNPVYDVRVVEVVFIAETARLPRVFDALAARNFMTVSNVRLSPADPFEAARAGFLYGVEPVSEVRATIETIWLREWTAASMPAVVRTSKGISTAAPQSDAASDAG